MKGQVIMMCKFNLTYLTFLSGPLPDPRIIASVDKLQDKRPQPGIFKLLHGAQLQATIPLREPYGVKGDLCFY